MKWIASIACVALSVGLLGTGPAAADIIVSIDPADDVVILGDAFTVDIVADIPEADAVLGWGLDFTIDDGLVLSQVGDPAIGPLWDPAATADGDGLAGSSGFPPVGIWGDDLLLATITLSADALGETDLLLSDDYPADMTEGFPLDPTGFATVVYYSGHVTVVPEPATLSLLALGGLALLRRR